MKIKNIILLSCLFPFFGSYAAEPVLVSGDVAMIANKNSDGSYNLSYSAYGETLNGSSSENPAIFISTRKDYYGNYESVTKDGNAVKAVAIVKSSAPSSQFEVTDLYKSEGNGEFRLDRTVKILSVGNNPYGDGFYSSFGINTPETNIADSEYFIPSVMYRGNFMAEGNIPDALPKVSDNEFCYREDRVTLPLSMQRRKSDGLTITVVHQNTKCETVLNDHLGVETDAAYQFGGIGFIKRNDGKITNIVTYPGNDTRRDGMGKRCHPLSQDFDQHNYTVYYRISKTDSYASAVESSWSLAFKLYDPKIYTEDLKAAYSGLLETVNTYYMSPGGDVKGPGFPWGVDLRDFHLNRDTYELGFVGAQPVAGYALYRAGLEEGNEEWRKRGEQVLTFWATKSLSELGLPKSRFAALHGTWDDWAYTSIRQGCNGMAGLLNAWCYAKKNGINRPAWLNSCVKFGDFLVENQNADGSFYLEYHPFKIEGGKHPAGNKNKLTTTCSLRYLTELYLATGDSRYKETALKAAEFCYKNVHEKYLYVACVIDNPQTIDSESGQQALNGFLSIYDLTGDKKWLAAAEQAAIYTASWTFMYDVPVETDQTEETDWPKDRSIIGQHIIAVGHSAADLGFAWSSFVYYRLYLMTGKELYLKIARVAAHNSKLSMNLRQELYPGKPEGLQQEAFTVRTSKNPRRTHSVMEALTWNFAAHLDPMLRFKDAFGTCDMEEVEKMPKEKVLEMNERYGKYQSSDYGQDASVSEVVGDESNIKLQGRTLTVSSLPVSEISLASPSGDIVFNQTIKDEEESKEFHLDGLSAGFYVLLCGLQNGGIAAKKLLLK